MAVDVYHRLAQHLDNLPAGYPATESGVEQRILRRLFTPEDAELALHLTLLAEEPRVVARRAGIPVEEVSRRLEDMARRGLVSIAHQEGKPPRYQAAQFVIGIWEYQLNRLDPELIRDVEEYLPALSDAAWTVPQLRTIPVGESIGAQLEAMPYEQAGYLVRAQKTLAVAPCICRRERKMVGEGCDRPEETCLLFGSAANHYVHNGMARYIDQDEALTILSQAEEAGLVFQPGNSEKPQNICCCCGCCCGVLRNVKQQPKPASWVASMFVATLDADTCQACGTCETRCQMEAIWLEDEGVVLDTDRCIGCGLCVTTCPTESLSLVRKPESERPYLPKNTVDTYIRLGRARGKLGVSEVVGLSVRSMVDRLLAPR
jgi:electron transport complex protein RnfB